jgi:hypothetical protein
VTSEPQTATRLPRRFLLYHPLLFLVIWAVGVGIVSLNVVENTPLLVPVYGAKPLGSVVIGLIAGLALVVAESWRVRRHFDATVRAAVLSAPGWPWSRSGAAVALAILAASHLANGFVLGRAGTAFAPLVYGCWLLPYPLLYHAYRPVGEHAARLQVETSADAATTPIGKPSMSLAGRRAGIMLDVIVVLSIAGALAAGAWLQWAAPRMLATIPLDFTPR